MGNISYEEWLDDLRDIAETEYVTLAEEKYHYHTYFMRGYSPKSVISDIKSHQRFCD